MSEYKSRKNIRLTEFDYNTPGAYFVTVCTHDRQAIFWENVGATIGRPEDVRLSAAGQIVEQAIRNIPACYPGVYVDVYTVMPDHIHLLLQIEAEEGRAMPAPTVSRVVQQLKGAVTKRLKCRVWQKGFYDHVVRGDADYREIWTYIEANPMNREKEQENMGNPY